MTKELLLAYAATNHKPITDRLLQALAEQKSLEINLGVSLEFTKLLVTDVGADEIPFQIREFFGDNILTCNPYTEIAGNLHFNLSKFRNATIEHALKSNFEWVMLCDSDTVVVPGAFDPPKTAYGIPNVYWQISSSETAMSSYEKIRASHVNIFSDGNSWFLLSRQIMQQFKFNEQIYGYGWEDIEFQWRISRAGGLRSYNNQIVIHKYHGASERNIDRRLDDRNRTIALGIREFMKAGVVSPYEMPDLLVIDALHPHWKSKLVLYAKEKMLLHVEHNTVCEYDMVDDHLSITWSQYPKEIFVLRNGVFYAESYPVPS